jgi:hypothetical protein
MTVRSKATLMVGLFVGLNAIASVPSDRRLILTAGEKVNVIHYQLGQSTFLYFGFRPETVICGNKNYFNIEKIKEGVTIQPLSNFSTNLTVISGTRLYLFYLTPAGAMRPDGVVDARFVPSGEVRLLTASSQIKEVVKDLGQKVKLDKDVELSVAREILLTHGKQRIWELSLRNSGTTPVKTSDLAMLLIRAGHPVMHQTSIWEGDTVPAGKTLRGRIIANVPDKSGLSVVVRFRKLQTKVVLNGNHH